ncbi:hypothetical protein TNCV_4599041 [Trichonephila clavipes]|nr:hypothetical protein TNCV_4599041 [Trichonephila clavipes]
MSPPQEKAQVADWFIEFRSAIRVQCKWGAIPQKLVSEKKFPGEMMERGSPVTGLPYNSRHYIFGLFLVGIREKHCLPIFN